MFTVLGCADHAVVKAFASLLYRSIEVKKTIPQFVFFFKIFILRYKPLLSPILRETGAEVSPPYALFVCVHVHVYIHERNVCVVNFWG